MPSQRLPSSICPSLLYIGKVVAELIHCLGFFYYNYSSSLPPLFSFILSCLLSFFYAILSKTFTAVCCISGIRWLYVLSVVCMLACPKRS
nr:MAG TPA: hypothetical protein [Caudoviricetes sp.]